MRSQSASSGISANRTEQTSDVAGAVDGRTMNRPTAYWSSRTSGSLAIRSTGPRTVVAARTVFPAFALVVFTRRHPFQGQPT